MGSASYKIPGQLALSQHVDRGCVRSYLEAVYGAPETSDVGRLHSPWEPRFEIIAGTRSLGLDAGLLEDARSLAGAATDVVGSGGAGYRLIHAGK